MSSAWAGLSSLFRLERNDGRVHVTPAGQLLLGRARDEHSESRVAFYRALFGWDVVEHDIGPNGVYTIFTMRGQDVAAATAISPVGCRPFESRQGLCGLAFSLGDKNLHIAVPPNGIEQVRMALDTIEAVYRQQRKA